MIDRKQPHLTVDIPVNPCGPRRSNTGQIFLPTWLRLGVTVDQYAPEQKPRIVAQYCQRHPGTVVDLRQTIVASTWEEAVASLYDVQCPPWVRTVVERALAAMGAAHQVHP